MIPPRRRIAAATPPAIASFIPTPSDSHNIQLSDTNPKVVSDVGSQLDPSALGARMENLTMSNVGNQDVLEADNVGVQSKQVCGRKKMKKDGPALINKQSRRSTRINTTAGN